MNHATRTEIIRVRVTEQQKSLFAKCSASLGLPSATHAYGLMVDAIHAHVSQGSVGITGANCWPLSPAGMPPGAPKSGSGCRQAPLANRASGRVGMRRQV